MLVLIGGRLVDIIHITFSSRKESKDKANKTEWTMRSKSSDQYSCRFALDQGAEKEKR